MKTEGIRLELDANGQPYAVTPETGELCSGLVVCPNCEKRICSIAGIQWMDIKKCPIGKWDTYWFGHTVTKPQQFSSESCPMCNGRNFWRLKGHAGAVVCAVCHPPPFPEEKIEHVDIAAAGVVVTVPAKNPKVTRSARVIQKKKKQQKIFS